METLSSWQILCNQNRPSKSEIFAGTKDWYSGSVKVDTKLLGYAFIVEYKHGKENLVVDALSRREATGDVDVACGKEGTLCIISFPTPNWLDDLKASYITYPAIQQTIQALKSGQNVPVGFTICNDFLFYKAGCFWEVHLKL